MAEVPNLFTFFLFPAVVAVLSIVSDGRREDDGTVCEHLTDIIAEIYCKRRPGFRGQECVPFWRDDNTFCKPECLCDGGRLMCDEVGAKYCTCWNGWKGVKCTEPCSSGYYGRNCAYRCKCMNNGTCDRFSGKCTCTPGYQGSLCEEKCPNGTHGLECSNECKCQNDAVCHHVDGSCDCTAGWMGEICAEPCLEGTYGIKCSETCDCFKNSTCNVTTGACIYADDICECHCDVNPTSEADKLNDCQENPSALNKKDSCLPGFSGTNCENRACPANKWGMSCSNECKCRNGSYCHPATGVCWCELGWTGEDCSFSLNEAHFKEHIMKEEYSSSHSSSIVVAICVPMVALLLVIISAVVYYKKRSFRNEDNLTLPSYSELDNKEDLSRSDMTVDVSAEDYLVKE